MSKRILNGIDVTGAATLRTVADAGTNTDKFLVLNSSGLVTYRTAAELYADLNIGALPAGYTSAIKHEVKAGVAINKGQAVYVSSSDGTNMIVSKASNASEATSSKTMGLLETSLAINGKGNVVAEGLLAGLDTTGATNPGDPVWLGTNGDLIYGLTNKPYAPAHLVFIGIVTRINANNGEIFVKVQNGFELDELHNIDLKTTSPINGHILGYNGTLWVNKTISGWLGYTPADAANIPTRTETVFTATANQTTFSVNYTVGSVEVFYNGSKMAPSEFTATNGTSIVLGSGIPAGTILTVVANGVGGGASKAAFSATAPLAYDSNTGVFSIQAASGSQDGYLSSTNWTTFNNKVSSQWVTSGSDIYYSTGKVSVGTSTIGRKLSVYSTGGDDHLLIAGVAPSVSLTDSMGVATYQAKFGLATSNGQFATGATAGDFVISCQAGSTIWAYNSVEKMRLNTAGKLLIGTTTTSSSSLLVVNGDITATTLIKSGGTSSQFLKADGSVDSNAYITSSASITGSAASAGYLTGGDSNFYAYLYNSNSGDLNSYNSPGLYSSEYTGTTNRPVSQNGHWIQISDASGTDVKTQWYYQSDGAGIYMRLQWGNGTWRNWRTLITDSNIGSQSVSYASSAGGVAWSNVSGRPTAVSSFSNDSGYITSSTGSNFTINNSSPTIYLQDTDHRSSMIHCNSNIFYVLRGSGTNSGSWSTYNGYWPLEINLENNNATFGGNITAIYDVTAYSDARVKKNVTTIEGALDKVMNLRGVRYQRIDMEDEKFHIGVIAQETQPIVPEIVNENDKGHLNVAYGNMGGLFIEAIKELNEDIKELKRENNELRDILKRNNLI